jgi:hypothetical protein
MPTNFRCYAARRRPSRPTQSNIQSAGATFHSKLALRQISRMISSETTTGTRTGG